MHFMSRQQRSSFIQLKSKPNIQELEAKVNTSVTNIHIMSTKHSPGRKPCSIDCPLTAAHGILSVLNFAEYLEGVKSVGDTKEL